MKNYPGLCCSCPISEYCYREEVDQTLKCFAVKNKVVELLNSLPQFIEPADYECITGLGEDTE